MSTISTAGISGHARPKCQGQVQDLTCIFETKAQTTKMYPVWAVESRSVWDAIRAVGA